MPWSPISSALPNKQGQRPRRSFILYKQTKRYENSLNRSFTRHFFTLQVSPHSPSRVVRQLSIPSVNANQISNDDLFEHLDDAETPYPILISSNEPLNILEEMGFTDRAENQRLLAQNQNDLSAVIDLLTARNSIETDWKAAVTFCLHRYLWTQAV